ncbi:MAG: endonuclease/exonuclease/phosphatase family protein [Flavobacteriales bacterium]|nr:endonuclease/exonuclease/phosphatase family protein [Flavobacteriales bacterium]MCB9448212.1 endonuclease/exonuclease/phosphatase family protein [Flavobacteriales bacterium]
MKKWKRILSDLEVLSALAVLCYMAAISLPSNNIWYMAAASLAWQAHLVLLGFGLYLIVRQRLSLATIHLFAACLVYTTVIPTYPASLGKETHAGTDLRIAHFNVLKSNRDYISTLKAAKESCADFLSFQEVNEAWTRILVDGLKDEYPYRMVHSEEECCFGIAVFSKYPLDHEAVRYFGGVANLTGCVCKDGQEIAFITLHPQSPTSEARLHTRNRHLLEAADYFSSIEGPKLAIGDFNTVPWDRNLEQFRDRLRLTDSRKNLAATYPSFAPMLRIPIDHILHSNQIRCTRFDTITSTSSDHLGVVGDYIINS